MFYGGVLEKSKMKNREIDVKCSYEYIRIFMIKKSLLYLIYVYIFIIIF